MMRQPIEGQGLPTVEASISSSVSPKKVGILWKSDQPDAGTYT